MGSSRARGSNGMGAEERKILRSGRGARRCRKSQNPHLSPKAQRDAAPKESHPVKAAHPPLLSVLRWPEPINSIRIRIEKWDGGVAIVGGAVRSRYRPIFCP